MTIRQILYNKGYSDEEIGYLWYVMYRKRNVFAIMYSSVDEIDKNNNNIKDNMIVNEFCSMISDYFDEYRELYDSNKAKRYTIIHNKEVRNPDGKYGVAGLKHVGFTKDEIDYMIEYLNNNTEFKKYFVDFDYNNVLSENIATVFNSVGGRLDKRAIK